MELIGNSFPLSLIRRRVIITPRPISNLQERLRRDPAVASFWGHANTLSVACDFLGFDLRPHSDRPVLRLSPDLLPMLENQPFATCWILSPDYVADFRPAIGEEVPAEKIRSWQLLQMDWPDEPIAG